MRSIVFVLRFDHVILAVEGLQSAANDLLDEHGLDSVEGGRHSGHGTANRLVPLGRDYLELVAVVDQPEAERSPFGRWVSSHSLPGSWAGLCLRTADIGALAERLDLTPIPMSRTRPDGLVLSWRLLGMEVALERGLPFFIEWDVPPESHPGRSAASHRSTPRGISWVELGDDRGLVPEWLGLHGLDVRIVDGDPGVHRVGISTEAGEIVI